MLHLCSGTFHNTGDSFTRLPFLFGQWQSTTCRQMVTRSGLNSFQTQFLITIQWPKSCHHTCVIIPFDVASYHSMLCSKHSTNMQLKWWRHKNSTNLQHYDVFLAVFEQLVDGGIFAQTASRVCVHWTSSIPMCYRFYSTIRKFVFEPVVRCFVIMIRSMNSWTFCTWCQRSHRYSWYVSDGNATVYIHDVKQMY